MWICGVARNIAYNAELAIRCGERFSIDERWDLGREVDAVDEDI